MHFLTTHAGINTCCAQLYEINMCLKERYRWSLLTTHRFIENPPKVFNYDTATVCIK